MDIRGHRTKVGRNEPCPCGSGKKYKNSQPEFLPDSAEQIARSIEVAGVRDKLDQAFRTAIARVREHPQRSSGPATNEAKEGDSL